VNNESNFHITNEDIQQLPLKYFEGDIHVIETLDDCHEALNMLCHEPFLGFDTEAKPTFNKGEYNPTSLVQLSSADEAFLFRLNKIGYPQRLFNLLSDGSIIKLGISIMDDLKDLKRLRKFIPKGFIDLNATAKELGVQHMGVKKLAAIFLEYRISKNQQTSNWENSELTPAQQRYAATDAWVCHAIHSELLRKGYV